MKIFIEDGRSDTERWVSLLAENADEKRELGNLYHDAQPDTDWVYTNTHIKWEQQGFKLMFMLQEETGS